LIKTLSFILSYSRVSSSSFFVLKDLPLQFIYLDKRSVVSDHGQQCRFSVIVVSGCGYPDFPDIAVPVFEPALVIMFLIFAQRFFDKITEAFLLSSGTKSRTDISFSLR
jgi:hypothetical protein